MLLFVEAERRTGKRLVEGFRAAAVFVLFVSTGVAAFADERPELKSQRWQEDWRAFCDASQRIEPLDRLKCIKLGAPGLTLSLGGELRERFDTIWNPTFGFDGIGNEHVWLTRMLVHGDLRYRETARVFVQLGSHYASDRAFGNPPTDRNDIDLQQIFADLSTKLDDSTRLTLRGGRQEISLGSSRLVSVRESPNVRRSFDGARAFAVGQGFRLDAISVQPVELEEGAFDDRTDQSVSLRGVYGTLTGRLPKGQMLDIYYLGYERKDASFAAGTADEERHSFGTRYAGKARAFDWDVEAVLQTGSFGAQDIRAWTIASDIGYSFSDYAWQPRLGLKANIASGDGDVSDGKLETFNAMFPKLPYFTEANLIAPANFMDVHPTVSFSPLKDLEVTFGWDVLWKQQSNDAFYATPLVPVDGTAGSGKFIGHQTSVDLAYSLTPNISLAGSYVHFWAGDGLREAGGRDGDYVGAWSSFRF